MVVAAPFAEIYGIRPWEVDRLDYDVFCGLETAVHEAARKASLEKLKE